MSAILRLTLNLPLALVAAASAAGQSLIAADNFNAYPLGSINLQGHGTGWGGTFWFGHPGVTVVDNGPGDRKVRVGTDGEQFQARYIDQTPHVALVENGQWGKDYTSLYVRFRERRVPGTNSHHGGGELRNQAQPQVRLGAINPQGELGVHHIPSGQIALIPGTSADSFVRVLVRIDYRPGPDFYRMWLDAHSFPPTTPPDLSTSLPSHQWDLVQLSAGTSTTGGYDIDDLEIGDASGWNTNVPQLGAIPPSGGAGSLAEVSGVSADGDEIAGTSIPLAPGQPEAFVWGEGLGSSGLGALPGDIASRASGVSDDGSTAVGWSYTSSTDIEAWRWHANPGMQGLGFLPGDDRSMAEAVSGDGAIIVGSSRTPAFLWRAVMWDSAGNITELPALVGQPSSHAWAVSSDGTTIVGVSQAAGGSIPSQRAVAWILGSVVALGVLPGYEYSSAKATSADGSVIVGTSGSSVTGVAQAFAWTAAGMIGLGTLPGDANSEAVDVSGDGRMIVGNSFDGQGGSRAFLLSPQTGMVELQTYLASLGTIGLAGWELDSVKGISADGTTIIGMGVDPLGADAAWRVVIPPSGAPTIGAASCTPGALNSTGVAGQLTATGSVFVPHNDVTLHATSLPPNSFGFFLVSRVLGAPIVPPGSLGNLCLTSPIGRYVGPGQIQNTGAVGAASLVLDLTLIPQPTGFVSVAPGETWHFQLWNRDAIGGIATSVFTAARSIQF